jgi:NADH-quinone oxidoreductase subunit N
VSYYLLAYLFSNLAVFLVVVTASDAIGGDTLEGYSGLSKRSPFLAAAMFVGLLSLAGIPPLAGFVGKLLVLLAAADSRQLWLVGVGAVNVAISLYYYLMVVKRMYLSAPATAAPIRISPLTKLSLSVLLVGVLLIGIIPAPFLQHITLAVHP